MTKLQVTDEVLKQASAQTKSFNQYVGSDEDLQSIRRLRRSRSINTSAQTKSCNQYARSKVEKR
jgi:hypothetical protein